jgi:hypothetical protein
VIFEKSLCSASGPAPPVSLTVSNLNIENMNLKKLRKLKKKNSEIGKMIQAVGNDLIMLGETAEKRENYLQTVCVAWNISCLPESTKEQNIHKFVTDFRKMNKSSDENTANFEHSVRSIIEEKIKLYPDVHIEIVDASLEEVGGKDLLKIISRKIK